MNLVGAVRFRCLAIKNVKIIIDSDVSTISAYLSLIHVIHIVKNCVQQTKKYPVFVIRFLCTINGILLLIHGRRNIMLHRLHLNPGLFVISQTGCKKCNNFSALIHIYKRAFPAPECIGCAVVIVNRFGVN